MYNQKTMKSGKWRSQQNYEEEENEKMTSDMSITERLSRQKNTILQRQLDVTLQILEKEDRSTQQHLRKLTHEYRFFLRSLNSTWTSLDTYTQPDTRAMKKNAALKDRRMSIMPTDVMGHVWAKAGHNTETRPGSSLLRHPSASERYHLSSERPKFQTCLEVLDDIIKNHHLRKKTGRHRRIGLVIPTSARTRDSMSPPDSARYFDKTSPRHSFKVRPSSSYIPGRTKTADRALPVRPLTAQAYGHQGHRSAASPEDMWRPVSASHRPVRPKSAPPNYELYGRSPAMNRQTVSGIMAEMHSRAAATREMVRKSKRLHNYISSLAWADT